VVERIIEKLNTPVAVLCLLVLIIAVNTFLFFFYRYPATTSPSVESNLAAAQTSPSEGGAASLEEGKTLPVVVDVVDAPAGLSIYEDGQLAVDQVSEPGFSQEFEPEDALTISTDNAGAVRTEVGGWDLGPLGAGGEAVTRDFTAGS
jgi:Domain of unknown function (DUF4115)